MPSTTPRLLGLLLLASLIGGAAANPLSATVSDQGSGRPKQGRAYSLTCVVDGPPGTDTTSSYVWYKNGDIIREETEQILTFTRLTHGDAGMYQCGPQPPDRLGLLLSYPFQIRVFGMHKMIPKPVLGAWTIPVLHQPFELICTVFGLPQHHDIHLTYTWFKDSRDMPGQTSKSLLFPSLTREDGGVYVCRARSGHVLTTSPDSNEKNLRILLPPHVHMEPAAPDNVIRRAAGEELTLTCKVTEAFPWVTADGYSWSYLPSHQGPRRSLEGRGSTLKLGPLTRKDSGQYFCQARNDLYSFQGLLPPGNASITVDVHYIEQIDLTADLKVKDENRLTLTCSVTSNPAARLSWVVDGREVRHVTYNVDHYVVEKIACSDNKTYTCRASNAHLPGLEEHASTNVGVVCNRNALPSVHVEPATSHTVITRTAGEELTLNCNVAEAIPWVPADGFRWSHLPSLQGEHRPLMGRESTLRLGPLTREDSGLYSCWARSDLEIIPGRVLSANYSIIVDVVYMEDIILTPDLEVNEGDRVTLTCSVASNPAARLSWEVDGREVRHVTNDTDYFVLERAACSDSKTYTCRASNPDLPGLERHASTSVKVDCNGADEPAMGSATSLLLSPSPLLRLLVLLLVPLIMR